MRTRPGHPRRIPALAVPMTLGVLAAAGFATSFVLNRGMSLSGGSWLWSASLRYLFMVVPMAALVAVRGGLPAVLRSLRARPARWLLWSTIGFGLFYAPLAWASQVGAGWLVASTWQLVIVAGIAIGALGGNRVPLRTVLVSLLIVIGVVLTQLENTGDTGAATALKVVVPVVIAAVAYPLGNRMLLGTDGLDGVQRTLAMTLGSLPLWLVLAAVAGATAGPPSGGQVLQCVIVALFSGVLATTLFFRATDLVRDRPAALGAVEATQAVEVPFTLLGEALLLGVAAPAPIGWIGLALILAGLCVHALGHGPAEEGAASAAVPADVPPPVPLAQEAGGAGGGR
ncbi:DMT family transporter [Streptomyces catenulae]|uniref:Multidrug resistance efflux transporter family protein n=1 Tax=Streptomyces catenulae TaxID=66875 RepID=A0ABV2Z614_9ACTN|nr:multidrug resistance efflux transporter family protein [Streptomyces catenulae]